ncbi:MULTISPECIES: hypothetical protein [Olleya]|jgi:hypothetical protein|uniref:Uncharacterized protein n=1 Tax=Olleya marilimosa TaxID=272164 RepID=A0ABR8LYR3_9FLAO|nr:MULTISPECIES: hypothetical protein [Olleya]MBD3863393.1 hypothetical protein [Olleya marilimosa]|tara:strand:- start:3165 stop:4214 length:1050 start_codon:yes stop_codon:yes gene_type:complete
MIYKEEFYELITILASISPLNADLKLEEIIEHTAVKEEKIHLQLIKDYLNDDELYREKIEKHLSNTVDIGNNIVVHTDLEPLFIFASLEFFIFDEVLNESEKKELILSYLNTLNIKFDGDFEYDDFLKSQELMTKYRLVYHKELFDLGADNLKNLEMINEILDVLNYQENILVGLDETYQQIFKTSKNFFTKKKEYFKDAYFIESELKKSTSHTPTINNTLDYSNYTNVFNQSMPIEIAVDHFKIFTEKNSKNGKPFLTEKQFDIFIKKAFCGIPNLKKQKFNMAPKGESTLVKYRFREFYESYYQYFGTGQVLDKFVELLTDNFVGWNFKNVKVNFDKKPSKTIQLLK